MSGLRDLFADTRPLRVPAFRRLWLANIVTVIGAQLTVVTIPAQIYADTGSSAYVGLAGVFGLVPLVIFGLWGGALADAVDRRTLLIVTTCGLIVTSALLWWQAAVGSTNVWLLLGLFALQQSFFAIDQPTRSAVIPRLVEAPQLPAANALQMTVAQAGAIAGPLLGGVLIPVLGFSWLYLIDTLCLAVTLIAVLRLPSLRVEGAVQAPGLRSVIDGFKYLRLHPILLMSFVVDIIAMLFGMPRALFPEIAHVDFGGQQAGGLAFALLFAAIPAGAVLGGIFSGWVSRVRRQGVAVIGSIVVWGVAVLAFGLASMAGGGVAGVMLVVAVVSLMIGGAADMASAAFRTSMLQSAAEDAVRGRLQGIFVVVVAGGPRLADTLHGAVAVPLGAAPTAAWGGALVVVVTILVALVVPAFTRYRVDVPRTPPTA